MSSSALPVEHDRLITDVIDKGRPGRQQLLVVGLCLVLNILDGFDITAIAVVATSLGDELSLTPERLGWVFSAALFGMMIGAMFLSPVADIGGRRRLILGSVAMVGIATLTTANAASFVELVLVRFASGVGVGAMLASQAALTAEYSPERYRALAVAVVIAGFPFGAMLTSVAAGYILPGFGWRGMFWFGGSLTLLSGVAAWFLMPESLKYLFYRRPVAALDRINAILDRLNTDRIAALPPEPATESPAKAGFRQTMLKLLDAAHVRTTLMLWLTFFLSFATLYFLMSWIPKLMEDSGFESAVARKAFLLFNLGGVLGIVVLGLLSVRLKLTNLVAGGLLLSAIGLIAFALAPADGSLLLTLIFGIGLLYQGGFTGLYGVAAKAYPTDIRSTGIGWSIGLGRSGAVVGPAVAGYLIAAGLGMSVTFIVFAVPAAVAALTAFRLHVR